MLPPIDICVCGADTVIDTIGLAGGSSRVAAIAPVNDAHKTTINARRRRFADTVIIPTISTSFPTAPGSYPLLVVQTLPDHSSFFLPLASGGPAERLLARPEKTRSEPLFELPGLCPRRGRSCVPEDQWERGRQSQKE